MDSDSHPVAGVDYPRTFQEMDEWFRDDEACRAYIRRLRWPEGFVCPHCGVSGEPWTMSDELLRCRSCHATHVADGRHDLRGHAQAAADVVHGDVVRHQPEERRQRARAAAGAGARQLRDGLDLAAQAAPGDGAAWPRSPQRQVEVDETYVGGPEKGKRGREIESKAIVAVAAEERWSGHRAHPIAPGQGRVGGQPAALRSGAPWCPERPSTPTAGAAMPV